jgi:hypothetical protein
MANVKHHQPQANGASDQKFRTRAATFLQNQVCAGKIAKFW